MPNTTNCPHCGAELKPKYLELPNASLVRFTGGRVCIGHEPCTCAGALAEIEAEERAEQARTAKAQTEKLRECGIPERYLTAEHPNAGRLADMVIRGDGAYIDGTQGTGKTHLAAATARKLIGCGYGTRFVSSARLMESLRSRKSEDRDETMRLAECRILILDDLGKESPTPYACERLFDLINERYNNMRPIIVTSNYTRGEISKRLLEGRVGDSIASRLCEMTKRIHIDGEDRRLVS